MTPEKLNETSDEILFACIDAIIASHSAGAVAQTLEVYGLAEYISFLLLHRVRERIVKLRNSGQCPLAIGKVWAWAVLALSCVAAPHNCCC